MLVTFKTQAHASITMFGEVAVALLKLMGHSGTVPSALLTEDLPEAITRLKAAVAEHAQEPLDPGGGAASEDGDERHVSLAHRAMPLLELLEAAAAQRKNVMWDSP